MGKLKHRGQIYFTFKNTSALVTPISFVLFASGVTPQFTIGSFIQITSSSVDYNFLNQALHNDPIWIKRVQYQSSQDILANAIKWRKFDANGKEMQQFDLPVNEISAYQAQSGIATINYKNLFLDGRTTLELSLPPLQSIELLMDYEQWKKTDDFSTPEPQSILSEEEILQSLTIRHDEKWVAWDREAIKLLPDTKMFDLKELNDNFNWD